MFEAFPKIPRLMRDIIITEKLDGTNAQVLITKAYDCDHALGWQGVADDDGGPLYMYTGSRNRFVTPDEDNFGFARWVETNANELQTLGEGRHYGEWWGKGIQRGYGLDEKRFSLFNTIRWIEAVNDTDPPQEKRPTVVPNCCHVVPILYEGLFTTDDVEDAAETLRDAGSCAAPGYMNPEGIAIFHTHANKMFKWTFDGDGHKG